MQGNKFSTEEETLLAVKFLIYFVVEYAGCVGREGFRTKMALRKAFKMTDGYLEDEMKKAFRLLWM